MPHAGWSLSTRWSLRPASEEIEGIQPLLQPGEACLLLGLLVWSRLGFCESDVRVITDEEIYVLYPWAMVMVRLQAGNGTA